MRGNEFWRYSSRNRDGHKLHPLTSARRNLVLELWIAGRTQDQIAFEMSIDIDTVMQHLQIARRAGDARAIVRHPATLKAMASA